MNINYIMKRFENLKLKLMKLSLDRYAAAEFKQNIYSKF